LHAGFVGTEPSVVGASAWQYCRDTGEQNAAATACCGAKLCW
jgi:hypothetical protein